MTIANNSPITASDLNGLFDQTITNLLTIGVYNTPSKQFLHSFRINGINNSTAEYLRTVSFYPRTDCILRGVRILAESPSAGINITATIPSQIVEDNSIVGGNILNTITMTATTVVPPLTTISNSVGFYNLSNSYVFPILAGDSIDIVLSSSSATASNVSVSLLLENTVVSR